MELHMGGVAVLILLNCVQRLVLNDCLSHTIKV